MCYSCGCFCGCGDDPCGCQELVCPQCTTTSTTSTTTTINPDCEPCEELYNCDCIIYNGPDLACYGIFNGDNLCKILYIAASNLPSCSITPPPTTTTTTCPCLSYNVVAKKGAAVSYSYVPCGGAQEIIEYLGVDPVRVVCAERSSIPVIIAGNASITPADPVCCTIPIPPPIIPTSRCISEEYWSAVANWSLSYPVSIQLNNMRLNGVQYATGQILNVNSASDLINGIGIDGNVYVMNISDWLTNIAIGSGFVFHDDMKVIDKPIATSTYDIALGITSPTTLQLPDIYYNNTKNIGLDKDKDGNIQWLGYSKCEPLK